MYFLCCISLCCCSWIVMPEKCLFSRCMLRHQLCYMCIYSHVHCYACFSAFSSGNKLVLTLGYYWFAICYTCIYPCSLFYACFSAFSFWNELILTLGYYWSAEQMFLLYGILLELSISSKRLSCSFKIYCWPF